VTLGTPGLLTYEANEV
jgi:hypothetical protein